MRFQECDELSVPSPRASSRPRGGRRAWRQGPRKPAYAEHKIALGYGVYGTPKHVIDGKLVPDTESAWGAADWAGKLGSL